MAFLAAFAGGGGGLQVDADSSQSAAITTGAFGGGTRGFGNINFAGTQNGSSNYLPYLLVGGLLIAGFLLWKRK